jgi:hypothetical protein
VQNPSNVASNAVQTATMMLVTAACQTSGSARMVSYHCVENSPSGMVGKRCELNEKISENTIGVNTKTKITPT